MISLLGKLSVALDCLSNRNKLTSFFSFSGAILLLSHKMSHTAYCARETVSVSEAMSVTVEMKHLNSGR